MTTTPGRESGGLAQGLIYLLPLVAAAVGPFLVLPLVTRVLGPHQYGAWVMTTAFASFVSGIVNCGLTHGYERNYFARTDPYARAGLLYSVVGFVSVASLLALVAVVLFGGLAARWLTGEIGHRQLLVASCAAGLVTNVRNYYQLYFRNTNRSSAYAAYSIVETLLVAVLTVVGVGWLGLGASGLPVAQLLGSGGVLLVQAYSVGRELPLRFDAALLREALSIGLPLTPKVLLTVVGSTADKYVLSRFMPLGEIGIYGLGQRLAGVAFSAATALENVFVPRIYRQMFLASGGKDKVGPMLTPFVFATVAIALPIALFADLLLAGFFPQGYGAAASIASVLVLHGAVMFFGKPPQLTYAKQTAVTSILSALSLVLTVGGVVVGTRVAGAIGAAMGTLVGGAVFMALSGAVRQRFFRINWEYSKIAAYFACLVVAVVLATIGPRGGWGLALVAKVLLLTGFAAVGVRTGAVDVDRLRGKLQRRTGNSAPVSGGE